MPFAHLLAEYGYLALFIGCLLEGETLLILAGFAAHQGYLSLPLVLLVAFCGGTLGDQLFFLLGHRYGPRLIARFPGYRPAVDRVNALLHRYHSWLIVGIRFMYGLRIVGPVTIGASRLPFWRFAPFNLLGAALWAGLVGGAGYAFGQSMQWLFTDFERYERLALIGIVTVCVLIAVLRRLRRRSRPNRGPESARPDDDYS
ncbi:DedA family protein [Jeongeupia chitinilytica]|uniref:Membrane protein n=1 Tax=Jeongeupia chitinilytica TaxID=1041641 RepID=A0ABQ3H6B4_9NEIS|nr:DedA family protein [Jeongeupia chitinilytica]GHD68295.1 membrane protein [Jeongeupia chitinilytica]